MITKDSPKGYKSVFEGVKLPLGAVQIRGFESSQGRHRHTPRCVPMEQLPSNRRIGKTGSFCEGTLDFKSMWQKTSRGPEAIQAFCSGRHERTLSMG
jgi:hypothetical protein